MLKHTHQVLTENLDDIGATLEHPPRKSLKRLAQETGIKILCKNGNTTSKTIQPVFVK
jgi:hypothetical protein